MFYYLFYSFYLDNEVDGDALIIMMSTVAGPNCSKEVVPKVGIRMKVYRLFKSFSEADDCVRFHCCDARLYV